VIIHLGRPLLTGSCDLPEDGSDTAIAGRVEIGRTSLMSVSLFGLAPQGVCLAEHVATLAGDAFTSPFHHRPPEERPLTEPAADRAVCSLLHSSVGSPRLAVSQPAVLWCSDFPLGRKTQRPVPHDAREPTQFVFSDGCARFGLLTDLGSITPHVLEAYADCDALCLEFNHEPALLEASAYPPSLRRRIAGPWGHLSNAQAGQLLSRLKGPRLTRVIAAHLSEKTNRPDLVADCLARVAPDLDATIAPQHAVVPWFEVGA